MLRNFNDDSLPATRRSIVLFTIFAVTIHRFEPTIDLEEIGFFKDLAQQTVEPQHFGVGFIFVFAYLLYRLVHFIPIYRHNADRVFEDFYRSLRVKESDIYDRLRDKFSALQSINNALLDKNLQKLDRDRREIITKLGSGFITSR